MNKSDVGFYDCVEVESFDSFLYMTNRQDNYMSGDENFFHFSTRYVFSLSDFRDFIYIPNLQKKG